VWLRYSDKAILVLVFVLGTAILNYRYTHMYGLTCFSGTYDENVLTFGFVACSLGLLYVYARKL